MPSKSATPRRLFGEAVRAERLRQELSQEELAHRSDITTGFMSRVERGVTAVSIDSIIKIARGLGMTGRDLMARAGI